MSNRLKRNQQEDNLLKIEQKIVFSFKKAKSSNDKIKSLSQAGGIDEKDRDAFYNFLYSVYDKCPKIVEKDLLGGFIILFKLLPWNNEVQNWKPKGKGRETIFYSLVDHLIIKYPVPKFLYKVFFVKIEHRFYNYRSYNFGSIFKYISNGGSLCEINKKWLPVPLTKRMRAEFLKLPAETPGLLEGIRSVQVANFNGNRHILEEVLNSFLGREFNNQEEFWMTVIQWFCNNPMLDKKHIVPIIDYINYRHNQENNFSMKGRSPLALIRGMEEWHGHLARVKALKGIEFQSSGYRGGKYITKKDFAGKKIDRNWEITEILSSKELADEGRVLHHCVYSYASSISEKKCSIWSLREDGTRRITIEVRMGQLAQVRGKYNRLPEPDERSVIRKWAADNNLIIGGYW